MSEQKREIEISPDADNNLDQIEAYLKGEASSDTAEKVIDQIIDRCEDLADMPRVGRAREEIAPGVRSVTTGTYVIYYRIHVERVEILRVLHSSRDIAAIKKMTSRKRGFLLK